MESIKRYATQGNAVFNHTPPPIACRHVNFIFISNTPSSLLLYQNDKLWRYTKRNVFFIYGCLITPTSVIGGRKRQRLQFWSWCALTFTHILTCINEPYWQSGQIITLKVGVVAISDFLTALPHRYVISGQFLSQLSPSFSRGVLFKYFPC